MSRLSGLGEKVLPAKPSIDFMTRWPDVLGRARRTPGFRLAVIGGGAAGVELALCAHQAFCDCAEGARVSLVTSQRGLVSGFSPAAAAAIKKALVKRGIDIHIGRATGNAANTSGDEAAAILMPDGETIAVDAVIAATGSRAPGWLAASGLKLDGEGFIEVGADLVSASHRNIYAAGDIIARTDQKLARSGVHAVKAGPVLAVNLRAAFGGGEAARYLPKRRTLYILSTGDRRAILSWGAIALSGRLVWYLKDWIDRSFVDRYARLAQRAPPPDE